MPEIAQAGAWIGLGFTIALVAIVATQLLNGQINTRRLLYGMRRGGALYFSPERVQLLMLTLWAAGSYMADAVAARPEGRLPDVSTTTLAIVGGSQAVYLAGKAYNFLFRNRGE